MDFSFFVDVERLEWTDSHSFWTMQLLVEYMNKSSPFYILHFSTFSFHSDINILYVFVLICIFPAKNTSTQHNCSFLYK